MTLLALRELCVTSLLFVINLMKDIFFISENHTVISHSDDDISDDGGHI